MKKKFHTLGVALLLMMLVQAACGECADARIGQTVAGIEALKGNESIESVLKLIKGASGLILEYCEQGRLDDALRVQTSLFGLSPRYGKHPKIAYEFARDLAGMCNAFARENRLEEAARFYMELSAEVSSFEELRDIAAEEAWAAQNLSHFYFVHKKTDERSLDTVTRMGEIVRSRLVSSDVGRSVDLARVRTARNLLVFNGETDRPEEAEALYDAIRVFCRGRDREFSLEQLKAATNLTWFYGRKGNPSKAVPAFTDAIAAALAKGGADAGELQLMCAQNLLLAYENARDLRAEDVGPAYTAYGIIVSLRAAFDTPLFARAEREALYRLIIAGCSAGRPERAEILFDQFVNLYADDGDDEVSRFEAAAAAKILEGLAQRKLSDAEWKKAEEIYSLIQPLRLLRVTDAAVAFSEVRAAHAMLKISGRAGEIEEVLNFYYRIAALNESFPEDRESALERIRSALSVFEAYALSSRAIDSLEFSRLTRIYTDIATVRSRFADDVEIAHLQAKAASSLFRLCRGADRALAGEEMERLTRDMDVLYLAFPEKFFYSLMM